MFVSTSTRSGCSAKRSAIFSRPMRTSSSLISFATTRNGTVGKRAWRWRIVRVRTVASPKAGVEDAERRLPGMDVGGLHGQPV